MKSDLVKLVRRLTYSWEVLGSVPAIGKKNEIFGTFKSFVENNLGVINGNKQLLLVTNGNIIIFFCPVEFSEQTSANEQKA